MQKTGKKVKKPSDATGSEALSWAIAEGMIEKKAVEIVILDLRTIKGAFTDFFILCSGNSDTHIEAISDSIEEMVYKKVKQEPWHREGRQNREWILLDYVDAVANVFKNDTREFYALEQLWGDAVILHVGEEGSVEQ